MSCLLKSVMTDCIAFRHLPHKDDARIATETLVCIAQSTMSGYTEAEAMRVRTSDGLTKRGSGARKVRGHYSVFYSKAISKKKSLL